jgi:hypothetical protein
MRHRSFALAGLLLFAAPELALAQRPDPGTVVVGFGTDAQALEPAEINSRDTQNMASRSAGPAIVSRLMRRPR